MDEAGLAELAGIVGAGGAALAVLAGRRATLLAGFGLLALAEALLAVSIAGPACWTRSRRPPRSAPGSARSAGRRRVLRASAADDPGARPGGAFPPPAGLRPRVSVLLRARRGRPTRTFDPLYAVLTASAAAFLYRALRRNEIVAPPRLIAVPTAAFLAFAALSLLWSHDIEAGANLLAFFLLPLPRSSRSSRGPTWPWLPRALAVIAIGLASVFAAVGLWQQATKELLRAGARGRQRLLAVLPRDFALHGSRLPAMSCSGSRCS